jgi:diguanylate cyclase (GGDEF)-like protein
MTIQKKYVVPEGTAEKGRAPDPQKKAYRSSAHNFRIMYRVMSILILTAGIVSLVMAYHVINHQNGQIDNEKNMIQIMLFVWLVLDIMTLIMSGIHMHETGIYEKALNQSEERLAYESEHDGLTDLYNRKKTLHYLSSIPAGVPYSIILMDVDQFKEINEIYGHSFGDKVLVAIADEVKTFMASRKGSYCRYGSDEFLMIIEGTHIEPDSTDIGHLRDVIHDPIRIGMASITPTVSIGIAYSSPDCNGEDVIIEADIAVHESKKQGRKMVTVFSDTMQKDIENNVHNRSEIYNAIENDKLYMVYQPKVDTKTLEVIGYEALVRIEDSRLTPAVFIPIAEENGWLRKIGRITTEKVIRQLSEWKKEGKKCLPVSVNFSSVQIRDTGYLDFLLETLQKYDVPSNLIQIEITESILLEHTQETINLMRRFHGAGIKLLMDDFGTGYSSLSYLNYIPLDVIKVDKSFLTANLQSEKKRLLLKDVIQLGHDLGTKIIVEGVETAEQYQYVKAMDADAIQGYYFSRPLMPDKAINFQVEPSETISSYLS